MSPKHNILRFIVIIIIFFITFIHEMFSYIPVTNHVYSYNVVTLYGTCNTMINVLYFYIYTFISKYAEPNVAVSSSPLMRFPGKLLRYFLNDSEMVPRAPVITGIIFVSAFLPCCIFIVCPLYFTILPSPRTSMFIIIIIIIIII